jgi:hypothetical protein
VSIRHAARYDLRAAVRVDLRRMDVIQNKNMRADLTRMRVKSTKQQQQQV